MLFYIGFYGRYGIGPYGLWMNEKLLDSCKKWWYQIFYVSNIIRWDCSDKDIFGNCIVNPCLTNTWYLNNEMQYLFVTVPIPLLTFKRKTFGIFFWMTVVVLNITLLTILTNVVEMSTIKSIQNIHPSLLADLWNNYYTPPWSRIGPYAVGILGGYFYDVYQRQLKKN